MATSLTALELFSKLKDPSRNMISFGCRTLDEKIGGIVSQGITEINGEAGCGKTQLCLTLSLQIQLDDVYGGKSGSVAYLSCGEGMFPIRRLSQLAMGYEKKTNIPNQTFLSNVHIEQCYNVEDVKSILKHRVPELCRTSNVKLLVIDSLAGLIRQEYDNRNVQEMKLRTAFMFHLAQQLKLVSDIFKISIVVVNQVKASVFDTSAPVASKENSSNSMPALGLAWSHCINSRITLSRDTAHLRHALAEIDEDIGTDSNSIIDILPGADHHKCTTSHISSDIHVLYEPLSYSYNKSNTHIDQLISNKENIHSSIQTAAAAVVVNNDTVLNKTVSSYIRKPLHDRIQYYNTSTVQTVGEKQDRENEEVQDQDKKSSQNYPYNPNFSSNNSSNSSNPLVPNHSKRSIRKMKLEFSPCHPTHECYYEITEDGIYGITLH